MEKSNALTILKHALLMERKGKSLYEKTAAHAGDEDVAEFFRQLAAEEQEHMDILERQFKSYMSDGRFMAGGYENDAGAEPAPEILNRDIIKRINAAGFEAAAITAAIGFEEKAVQTYADRAKETDDPEEKKLYTWLSEWEKTHLKKLLAVESSLIESVWHDNGFWPF